MGVPSDRYLGSPLARWLLPSTDHIENTATVFLTAIVCWTVYRAVAWQRVDQICYNILVFSEEIKETRKLHHL
jgi:hypothetical protein